MKTNLINRKNVASASDAQVKNVAKKQIDTLEKSPIRLLRDITKVAKGANVVCDCDVWAVRDLWKRMQKYDIEFKMSHLVMDSKGRLCRLKKVESAPDYACVWCALVDTHDIRTLYDGNTYEYIPMKWTMRNIVESVVARLKMCSAIYDDLCKYDTKGEHQESKRKLLSLMRKGLISGEEFVARWERVA